MSNQFWIDGVTLSEETSNNLFEYVRQYHNPKISFEQLQNEILEKDYYLCYRKKRSPSLSDNFQIIKDEYFLGEYVGRWIEIYPLWSSNKIGTYNSD